MPQCKISSIFADFLPQFLLHMKISFDILHFSISIFQFHRRDSLRYLLEVRFEKSENFRVGNPCVEICSTLGISMHWNLVHAGIPCIVHFSLICNFWKFFDIKSIKRKQKFGLQFYIFGLCAGFPCAEMYTFLLLILRIFKKL